MTYEHDLDDHTTCSNGAPNVAERKSRRHARAPPRGRAPAGVTLLKDDESLVLATRQPSLFKRADDTLNKRNGGRMIASRIDKTQNFDMTLLQTASAHSQTCKRRQWAILSHPRRTRLGAGFSVQTSERKYSYEQNE